MPCAIFAYPVATRSSVTDLGRDPLEDVLHCRPSFLVAAGHNGGAKARAFLAARDASADEQDAFFGQLFRATVGVGIERVAAVDDDVALLEIGQHVLDRLINHL